MLHADSTQTARCLQKLLLCLPSSSRSTVRCCWLKLHKGFRRVTETGFLRAPGAELNQLQRADAHTQTCT
jgi:hypothetical protein